MHFDYCTTFRNIILVGKFFVKGCFCLLNFELEAVNEIGINVQRMCKPSQYASWVVTGPNVLLLLPRTLVVTSTDHAFIYDFGLEENPLFYIVYFIFCWLLT